MNICKNIYLELNYTDYSESNIIIGIENKCKDKNYWLSIIESYRKNGEDFILNIDNEYSMYLYDKENDKLVIIADLVGLKPIFYHVKNDYIYIGDDLIELMNRYNLEKTINQEALSLYFRYHYIKSPETIFADTYKLKHGNYLVFKKGKIEVKSYWNVIEKFNANKEQLVKSYSQCKKELDDKLCKHVNQMINSNDNIGIYLSGGIDSSLVTALAKKYSKKPINTFSIGFYDKACNEADKAKMIAEKVGTNHHELYLNEEIVLSAVKRIPAYYGQPFGDSSELATIILNEFAKENGICNVLTGDGADQLFCGCNIFDTVASVQRVHKLVNPLNIHINPKTLKYKRKLMYIFSCIDKKNQEQFDIAYEERLIKGLFNDNGTKRIEYDKKINTNNWQEKRLIIDFDTFCCERVITKMGVAARKNGIEVYSPFLTKDIIEYSFRIPHKYKYLKRIKKYILKEILYQYIPKELIEQKKHGFSIPNREWLQTFLYKDLNRLSTKEFLEKQNLFNYDKVAFLIKNIDDKKYKDLLWDYYIFQIWYEMYML